MKTQTLRSTHISKTISEIVMVLGIGLIVTSLALFMLSSLSVISFIALIVGLVFLFIGYSNFAHIREHFKERLISAWLSETVDHGDFTARSGLSKTQVLKSLFFDQHQTITTHDLVSGALHQIAFVSGDVQVYAENETRFNGWLFMFDFNVPFACQIIHLPESVTPINHPSMHTRKLMSGYQTFLSSPKCYDLINRWTEALETLAQDEKELWFALHESKCYLAFNHHQDPFTIKLFKPINLKAIETFKTTLMHVETFIKTFKAQK